MWTMRLRRTGHCRGQRDALPTAAPFAHMPTAFDHVCVKTRMQITSFAAKVVTKRATRRQLLPCSTPNLLQD